MTPLPGVFPDVQRGTRIRWRQPNGLYTKGFALSGPELVDEHWTIRVPMDGRIGIERVQVIS